LQQSSLLLGFERAEKAINIMSTNDLIEGEALLDDEENDESFDEETGEVKEVTDARHYGDSSEEDDEDDDDEEAARAVGQRPSHCGPSANLLTRMAGPRRFHCRRG
jgi:hypothetical protein